MMNCSEVTRRLSAYADSELEGRGKEDVGAHVAKCAACAKRLEALEIMQARVRESLLQPVESPDMTESVVMLLPAPTRRKSVASRWAWGVAAVCVVAAVAIYLVVLSPRSNNVVLRDRGVPKQQKRVVAVKPGEKHYGTGIGATRPVDPPIVAKQRPTREPKRLVKRIPTSGHKTRIAPAPRPAGLALVEPKRESAPTVTIRMTERPLPASDGQTRRALVMTVTLNGRASLSVRETVVTSLPPDPDAAQIVRPPLKTVVERAPIQNRPMSTGGYRG